MANTNGKQVAVVVGATSKWQSDGRNTLLARSTSNRRSSAFIASPPLTRPVDPHVKFTEPDDRRVASSAASA